MRRARTCAAPRGVALLEVIVAIAILSTAGIAVLAVLREAFHAVDRSLAADREASAASAFLDAVSLWSRTELDQRLGTRRQGTWWLRVERESATLYIVALSDSTHREVLRTSMFRANSP